MAFLAAILGAVVGGAIALGIQLFLLREARKQREADHARQEKALATSLLFKLARMHSNLHGIHRHFWEAVEEGRKASKGTAEPWQVVLPLANPPPLIYLTPDEMGMLLAQKEDEVFNSVMDIEPIHNSLVGAVQYFNTERIALGEKVAAVSVQGAAVGNLVHGVASEEAYRALRPKMIGVNMLVEGILANAKDGLGHSGKTMQGVLNLYRTKLKLPYKLAVKADVDEIEAPPGEKTGDAAENEPQLIVEGAPRKR